MTVTANATGLTDIAASLRDTAAQILELAKVDTIPQAVSICIGDDHIALNDVAQHAHHAAPAIQKAHDALIAIANYLDGLANHLTSRPPG